jgi:hypothetical protein
LFTATERRDDSTTTYEGFQSEQSQPSNFSSLPMSFSKIENRYARSDWVIGLA